MQAAYGMIWITRCIHWVFLSYYLLFFVRVVGSWFPAFQRYRVAHFVGYYTDPYLKMLRRIIPPIGGVLDLSPLLGFFCLEITERTMLWFLRFFL